MKGIIGRRIGAAIIAVGVAGGVVATTTAPAEAAGKKIMRSIKIQGYNAFTNCKVGTNASQITLKRQGYTISSATCTAVSNGTWTGVVWYYR